jgi:hypothetical protein
MVSRSSLRKSALGNRRPDVDCLLRDLLPQCRARQSDDDNRHDIPDEETLGQSPIFCGDDCNCRKCRWRLPVIGDVTTTMLWIGGQITPLPIIQGVFLPSLINLLVPLFVVT